MLSAGLLLIAALVVVIATGVRRSESYRTHIGSRVPPAEAGFKGSGGPNKRERAAEGLSVACVGGFPHCFFSLVCKSILAVASVEMASR